MPGDGRREHRADADRIDVVEMGALELDAGGAEPQRLVDREIGNQRADPCDGDDGVKPQNVLEHLENAELHQHQRDRDVEHQPDHPSGMAVGQTREEVRPRERAGIGVGHVDLDLRDDDEGAGEGERQLRRGEHVLKSDEIHLRRLGGLLRRHQILDGEERQERACQHLENAGNDPAGTSRKVGSPPAAAALIARRQKPQKIDLFADLSDQREYDGRSGAEQDEIERLSLRARDPGKCRPSLERPDVGKCDKGERKEMQADPDRLRPKLQAADEGDAVRHERNDDQRAQHVACEQRNAEAHLQRKRHDRGFDGEEQKGERGVDQRRDRRSDVAEAGAAGEQVDVDAIGRGVIGDWYAGEKDQRANDENGAGRVDEAVVDGDRSADGLEREERDRADRGIGHREARPSARTLGRETKRVVLQRLVRDPLIVAAPDANDALLRCHGRSRLRRSLAVALPRASYPCRATCCFL